MRWKIEFFSEKVRRELDALPVDMRASFERITHLIESYGLSEVRESYVKHLEGSV